MPNARRLVAALALATVALLDRSSARAGGDWNDAAIGWKDHAAGLAAAAKEKKPVCLVFYTEWCPHCANYSKLFHDPRVVEQSKKFVMVRVDNDKEKEISQKYAPDGQYIPRTFFLSSAGELDASIQAPKDKYKYFYDERDPAQVLAAMETAAKKLH
jgi:thioredoxin-like negative regulator of GroEL